jgi:hypothetical protein
VDDEPQILPFRLATSDAPTKVLTTKDSVIRFNDGLPQPFLDALLQDPASFFASAKLLRATPMRAAALVRSNGRPYIIKHYYQQSFRHSIDQAIRGPEALRAYEVGCVLADAGVRTPRPVACVNNLHNGKFGDSYLLYPYIEGRMLRSSINQELLSDDELGRTHAQLAEMWRQFARLRIGLIDANAGNFIVTPNCVVWLIDLDGSRIHKNPMIARWRLQLSWLQVNRSMRRAMRKRGQPCAELRRLPELRDTPGLRRAA